MTERPRVEQRGSQPYVAIRRSGTAEGFASAVDGAFPELFGWLAEQGIDPTGPPFIRYVVFEPGGAFEIDLGAPVADEVGGDARVRVDSLPAGDYVTYLHRGAYRATTDQWHGRDLAAAHALVQSWATAEGLEWDGWQTDRGPAHRARIERYLVGPVEAADPAQWETELAFLIRR